MTFIKVPKPQGVYNPNRPVSSLLRAHIEHLHEAENRLPLHHPTRIYINAIKTEGEAAKYIRAVTEAINDAHKDAEKQRAKSRSAPRTPAKGRQR